MKPSKNDVIDLRTSRATSLETSSCTDAKPSLSKYFLIASQEGMETKRWQKPTP